MTDDNTKGLRLDDFSSGDSSEEENEYDIEYELLLKKERDQTLNSIEKRRLISIKLKLTRNESELVPVDELPQLRADEFELEEAPFSSGSYAEIFRARWITRGITVAIKIFKPVGRYFASYMREYEAFKNVKHPNIVYVYGIVQEGPWIVMELMENQCILTYIQVRRPQKLQAMKWFYQIASAMNYIHCLPDNNIIHRDIKPENLLLDRDFNAKITDFGISKTKYSLDPTFTTTNVGSLTYTAPEILRHEIYDRSVDVYSFGMTMWVILTRQPPYEYISPSDLAKRVRDFEYSDDHMSDGFVSLTSEQIMDYVGHQAYGPDPYDKRIPRFYSSLISECLSFDPLRRPSFDAIQSVLKTICETYNVL